VLRVFSGYTLESLFREPIPILIRLAKFAEVFIDGGIPKDTEDEYHEPTKEEIEYAYRKMAEAEEKMRKGGGTSGGYRELMSLSGKVS